DCELDLCLVLDKTKSVGRENYNTMLEAVRTLISKFNVGPRKTRFSIVTYDKKAQVRVSFKETAKQNKNALNNLLDSMKAQDRLGNPTRTDLALETVSNEVFTTANGDRPNAPNVMIVFTDGATHKSSKPYSKVLPPLVVSTRILSSLLHHIIANPSFMFLPAKGVHRIAVGIGKKIKSDELETIAGSPDRVVTAKSFDKLKKELDEIREKSCRIDGGYTEWSKWSECSATCGGGVRSRTRTCTNPSPKNGGKTCLEQDLGPAKETEKCNTDPCEFLCASVFVYDNFLTREGFAVESAPTLTSPAINDQARSLRVETGIDGGYSGWSSWSKCSASCGGGVSWSHRTCTSPRPSGDGKTCKEQSLGPDKKSKECNTQKCGIGEGYSGWSSWSKCSASCGGGVSWSHRTCTSPRPSGDGKTCKEQSLGPDKKSKECNTQKCGVDGGYSEWSSWSKCSATCGGGVSWSHRTCTKPSPSGDGKTCKEQNLGPDKKSKECNTQKCGIDGNWSPWSSPGPCDKTCGGGMQVRKRTCTNPPPSGDGKKCGGPSTKTESCNTQECPPPPPRPCREHLDVGVIIDSSNSIKPYDYAKARRFLQSLARRLQVSEAGSHMALILYSWEAHTYHRLFKFTDTQNINNLLQKIGKLPHIRGGTRTDRALELAAEDFFGWQETGDRPDVPNVLLVLTDGNTNEGSKPFSQVLTPLEAAGVRRIAIGIGNEINKGELVQIAGNQQDVIQVNSYGDLIKKLEDIMKLACEDQVLGSCGAWGPWGTCSKTCGSGFKVRRRQCPRNSLHLKEQKLSCNTNLCPGQAPCKDNRADCPSLAAAGKCWKQAIGQKFHQTFTLWNQCKKSCRRCNVDSKCQDNDPYQCPWLAAQDRRWCRRMKSKKL
ncbi:unnamed protein product, partial [Porites lobata]